MRTGFCKHCNRELFNSSYFGYCSLSCCVKFAHQHDIFFGEAKKYGSQEEIDQEEIERLNDRICELECSVSNYSEEESCYLDDFERVSRENVHLEEKIQELENLDWEKIKRDRKKEKEYNESVFRKMNNVGQENDDLKNKIKEVTSNNELLQKQNLDLLNTIKEMRGYSDRFNLISLDD